jgi:hypothetical protein
MPSPAIRPRCVLPATENWELLNSARRDSTAQARHQNRSLPTMTGWCSMPVLRGGWGQGQRTAQAGDSIRLLADPDCVVYGHCGRIPASSRDPCLQLNHSPSTRPGIGPKVPLPCGPPGAGSRCSKPPFPPGSGRAQPRRTNAFAGTWLARGAMASGSRRRSRAGPRSRGRRTSGPGSPGCRGVS